MNHLFAGQFALVALLEDVLLLFAVVELARSGIECDGDLFARLVAGLLDGFENQLDGLGIGFERGRESAFVADGGVVTLLLEHAFEGVEGFRGPAQGFAEALRANGHDHEFLEIDVAVGMRAAVQDVEHGRGQDGGVDAAEIAVKGNLEGLGHCASGSHGDGQDGIGAELAFVGGSIERVHGLIDEALVGGVHAFEFRGNDGFNIGHGLQNAFAEVMAFVAVAQLDGLKLAGGGSGWDNGTAHGAAFQDHVRFHGGIAARVKDFAGTNGNNFSHMIPHNSVQQPVIQSGTAIHGKIFSGGALNRIQKLLHACESSLRPVTRSA